MNKEDKEQLIEKWSPFMEGLSKSKGNRYKYASIYERTVLHNEPKYHKLLLSILYKLYRSKKEIPLSSKKHNLDFVSTNMFFDRDLYENGDLIKMSAIQFSTVVADFIRGYLVSDKINKVSYIKIEKQLETQDGDRQIFVYY